MFSSDNEPFSLITICYGRERHLMNLLRGVQVSEVLPEEIIIVEPGPSACLIGFADLPIKSVTLPLSGDGNFNVAKARNLGASTAKYDLMVFLDVDCLPDPTFFGELIRHPAAKHALLMGDPHYLYRPLPQDWEMASLGDLSVAHPIRPEMGTESFRTDVYGMFWSLCFLVSRSVFKKIGGFDDYYTGYGAEDTDFAFSARKLEIPLYLVPAVAYHQQHLVYTPPINHFEDIISNSRRFHQKWAMWPMDNWLTDFLEMNLIEWSVSAEDITVLDFPTRKLLKKCERPSAPYA